MSSWLTEVVDSNSSGKNISNCNESFFIIIYRLYLIPIFYHRNNFIGSKKRVIAEEPYVTGIYSYLFFVQNVLYYIKIMVWVITMVNTVFTIGYSGFQLNDFVKILKDNGILLVIDVRSLPYSQHYADFNKENISKILKSSKIYYRNYASELYLMMFTHMEL